MKLKHHNVGIRVQPIVKIEVKENFANTQDSTIDDNFLYNCPTRVTRESFSRQE